jgi:hypothetical protein
LRKFLKYVFTLVKVDKHTTIGWALGPLITPPYKHKKLSALQPFKEIKLPDISEPELLICNCIFNEGFVVICLK